MIQFFSELFYYSISKQGLMGFGTAIVHMLIGAHLYWLWFVKGKR